MFRCVLSMLLAPVSVINAFFKFSKVLTLLVLKLHFQVKDANKFCIYCCFSGDLGLHWKLLTGMVILLILQTQL